MNEWMNEWCIYIALHCVLLYTQSALQSFGGVSPQPPPEVILDPVVCLLGALPKKNGTMKKKYVLRLLLLIAKKNDNSTLEGRRFSKFGSMDLETEITSCLQMKMDIFLQRWKSITNSLDM